MRVLRVLFEHKQLLDLPVSQTVATTTIVITFWNDVLAELTFSTEDLDTPLASITVAFARAVGGIIVDGDDHVVEEYERPSQPTTYAHAIGRCRAVIKQYELGILPIRGRTS